MTSAKRRWGTDVNERQLNGYFRYAALTGKAWASTALAGTAIVSFANTAMAAEAPVPMMQEIVVTATGYGETRATHVSNITKIGETVIDFTKAEQPSELLNQVAGVGIEQGSGVEHLTAIRSPVLTGSAGAGSFLYLEDGVPLRAAGFGNVNALMEAITEEAGAIEVVRGPGSALYGSNAEHGLINVLSRAPSLTPEASLTGSVGPHGVYNLDGTASTTIEGENGTSQGLRGTFVLNEDGGFRANSGYGQQKGQLRYDFNAPDTRVRATLATINVNQETAGYVQGPDAYKNPALYKTNPDPDAYRDAWAIRSAVRFERDLDTDTTIALTPYMRTNGMNFLMHFQPGDAKEESGHWSGGLLTSFERRLSGGHKIIVGFDSEYTDSSLKEVQAKPSTPGFLSGVHYDYDVKSIVLAPYLHTIWQLTPATQLTAGLRYEYTRYDYTNNAGPTVGTLYSVDRSARPDDRIDTFSNPTPKLGLTHIFSDAFTGFINVARAARAPQTTDIYRSQKIKGTSVATDPDTIKSEILDSIEIGTRGQIGTLDYELSTYAMKKSNYTFRDADSNIITNGKTRHLGVELEVATPLIWNFDIAAAATYARHTYEFTNAAEKIFPGNEVDTAPRTIANVRLGYNFDEDRARLELEWVHMGAYKTSADNLHDYDGHDLLNLRAEYALTENLSVFGRLANILNTRYADRADFAFGNDRYFPGEDRAVYAGATVKF